MLIKIINFLLTEISYVSQLHFIYFITKQLDICGIVACQKYELSLLFKLHQKLTYISHTVNEENEEEKRKVAIVRSAINTLSYSELEAILHIFDELDGNEGILVASRIADRVGITRSVIVNALRKFESAGVIESRSSGMKGTYIKVVNDVVFDELDRIRNKNK